MRRGIAILTAAAALFIAGTARAQSSITLRSGAAVAAGEPVRLGHIAAISGPQAEQLGAMEIPGSVLGRRREIAVEDLRRFLGDAGVNWSTTTLRGGVCAVRVVDHAVPAPSEQPPPRVGDSSSGLRGLLGAKIAQILRADAADVRVMFSDADADLLDLAPGGRTLEVRVVGTSERIVLAVTVFEHDRIIAGKTIRVGVQVRRELVLAASAKRRGDVLSEHDITRDYQWVAPNLMAAAPERAIGAAVKSRLNAGEIITEGDLTPAVVVNKGDQVMVRALAGTVSVMTRARALADARDGELVQLASLDDPSRVITARMEGRGRAVLVATPTPAREQNR